MRNAGDSDRTPPRHAANPAQTSSSFESTWPTRPAGPDGSLRTIAPPIGTRRRRKAGLARWIFRLTLVVACAIPLFVLAIMGAVYADAHDDQARRVDAIVILGAAQYNGTPSPVLLARIEQALRLWNDGYAPKIVVTGGKQPGDAYTEAESEANYLIGHGVPQDAIYSENTGRDTWQSMQGVQAVLKGTGVHRLLIVSDGYHLLRAKLMARHLGFAAYGSPAQNSPIKHWSGDEFHYVIRETGGIIVFLPKMLF